MKIVFVLPALGNYGGVKSVVQLANHLLSSGVSTEICLTEPHGHTNNFEPLVRVSTLKNLQARPHDPISQPKLFVATRHDTLAIALSLAANQDRGRVIYFVQDYEPDFYEPESELERDAEATYRNEIPKIVKSNWLKQKLDILGGNTTVIEGGVNTNSFFPPVLNLERDYVFAAAIRHGSPRRNSGFVMKVVAEYSSRSPGAKIALFGDDVDTKSLPKGVDSLGLLSEHEVAELMRNTRVIIDPSLFQGWGRPGLEGLLCGALPIVTPFGGITEWATHRHNSVLMAPTSAESWAKEILHYAENHRDRAALTATSESFAERFALEREAREWGTFITGLFGE